MPVFNLHQAVISRGGIFPDEVISCCCMLLFKRHAKIGRNKIFSTYGDVHSVSDLRCAIDELFFCIVTVSIVINSSYCLELDYLLNSLFTC